MSKPFIDINEIIQQSISPKTQIKKIDTLQALKAYMVSEMFPVSFVNPNHPHYQAIQELQSLTYAIYEEILACKDIQAINSISLKYQPLCHKFFHNFKTKEDKHTRYFVPPLYRLTNPQAFENLKEEALQYVKECNKNKDTQRKLLDIIHTPHQELFSQYVQQQEKIINDVNQHLMQFNFEKIKFLDTSLLKSHTSLKHIENEFLKACSCIGIKPHLLSFDGKLSLNITTEKQETGSFLYEKKSIELSSHYINDELFTTIVHEWTHALDYIVLENYKQKFPLPKTSDCNHHSNSNEDNSTSNTPEHFNEYAEEQVFLSIYKTHNIPYNSSKEYQAINLLHDIILTACCDSSTVAKAERETLKDNFLLNIFTTDLFTSRPQDKENLMSETLFHNLFLYINNIQTNQEDEQNYISLKTTKQQNKQNVKKHFEHIKSITEKIANKKNNNDPLNLLEKHVVNLSPEKVIMLKQLGRKYYQFFHTQNSSHSKFKTIDNIYSEENKPYLSTPTEILARYFERQLCNIVGDIHSFEFNPTFHKDLKKLLILLFGKNNLVEQKTPDTIIKNQTLWMYKTVSIFNKFLKNKNN